MNENELIKEKNWWAKRKWLLLAVIVLFALLVVFFIGGVRTLGSFRKAYADKPLFDNAVVMVQNDSATNSLIGKTEPIDDMAIAEGTVNYSKGGDTLTATITVKGSLKKAKLDIIANKAAGKWEYTTMKIRTKDPKKEIDVLANSKIN